MGISSLAQGTEADGCDGDRAARQAAERALAFRRIRNAVFGPELFGEPAWELLLALLVREDDGARTAFELAAEVGCPESTAARWLRLLTAQDLVHAAGADTTPRYRMTPRARVLISGVVETHNQQNL